MAVADGTPRLVVTEPAGQVGLVISLSRPHLVIGHSETADLVLDDRFVSRRHALLTVDSSGTVTITDLKSTGGTFVNGERLTGPHVLRDGDLVQFADLVARFEPGVAPTPADAPAVPRTADTRSLPVPANPGTPAAAGPPPETVPPTAEPPDSGGSGADAADSGAGDAGATYRVTGMVLSPALPGVGGLTVQLVDKNVGGDQILARTQTASDGSYSFSHPISAAYLARHHKAQPDLQVQAVAGEAVLAVSPVRYSAPSAVSFDVVLPGAPGVPSEHETLTANLATVYPGHLRDLQENAAQQDITYLANKTGWDARAVALAALADQFSQITAPAPTVKADSQQTQTWPVPVVSIQPEFYYALFRAGLPADPDTLFQTSPASAQSIWRQAASSGVIPPGLASEVPAATANFRSLSAARSLDAPPPIGLSTLREMLAPTLPEPAQQDQFAQLYAQHSGDWPALWTAVEQELGAAVAQQLQLTGQLCYLTLNNQPLVQALTAAEAAKATAAGTASAPLASTLDLATRGYYDPAAWAPLIGANVPPEIPGADAAGQAANYAQLLAAQVRASYPTAVVADQVRRAVLPVAATAEVAQAVASFLSSHQADFQIGVQPVQAYLASAGLTDTPPEVITQIKRIQRVYQLTPDDTSLAVLLHHNLDSAFAITRYDAAGFVRAFSGQLGSADKARQIHARSRQVFASTLSVTMAYLGSRVSPVVGGRVPVVHGLPPQSAPPPFPVTAYPTLEDLFGSLDYCNCTDCNSILSPAAYLVDLLNYIDQPAPAGGGDNPQDVLFARRPDLQYLPLTCANTNTTLPYIDIVNEVLEYFVANGMSIAGYQGHDTGDAVTSAELVACPQYVDDAAYGLLQTGYFPPPLPFDRSLTLLRLQLASLGVTLPAAMAALRSGDALLNAATPTSYGWTDILIEQLSISRDEYRLFTDPFADLETQLANLYGLPLAPPAPLLPPLATLRTTSLQDFSRRLGVSYDDLVSIVSTRFINPNAALIPKLEQLGASFATLAELKATVGTPGSIAAQFIAALPAGLDATQYGGTDPADYQAVVGWVTDPQNYQNITSIITISEPAQDAGDCSGASLQFRYANPDNTANLLSGTDFLKLIRFIRLWGKLAPLLADTDDATAIEHTDHILGALYPAAELPADPSDSANDAVNGPLLDEGFATLLPRVGFLFQVMNQLSLTPAAALDQLLACWAPIGTCGLDSLYQSMFLTPTLLQQDPGNQIAIVGATVNAGDKLTTLINNVTVGPQLVAASQTAADVATAIATAINSAVTTDPVSGQPLNARFLASATGESGIVTIVAGFTLQCGAPGASETYSAAAGTPASRTATVIGPVTANDVLTTTIDGVPISYQVVAGDTTDSIAAGLAAAVNSCTVADPYSGLPLNGLVAASSAAAVITFTVADAGAPFTLACSLDPASAGSYSASSPTPTSSTATVPGALATGDTLVTTINSVPVSYTVTAADSAAPQVSAQVAARIAAAINAAVGVDLDTLLPLSSEVQASSSGSVVTVTAIDPSTPVTLSCSPAGYAQAGPFSETATLTVSGTIPPGTTLTTTINTLPLFYQVAPGDTAATIAAAITLAINTATGADPITNLPIPSIVTASVEPAGAPDEALVTLTAVSPTTPFTVAAARSATGYTASRKPPPFADDGYGNFLADQTQTVFGHEPALAAACNLTGAEFALITKVLGFTPGTPLTLDNVSALFRHGWLAHALGRSVLEFELLIQWTGLDPFDPIDPGTPPPAEPPVIRFIRLLDAVTAAGLTTAQALYLIWNQDISGTSAPLLTTVTGLAATLTADFAAVEAQFTIQADPDGSIAQNLMTLVYGTATSANFFGLLNGTTTTSVSYSTPAGVTKLPQPVIDASGGRLSYDGLAKQLTFGGVLDAGTQGTIELAVTASAPDVATLTAAVASLGTASRQSAGPFFATYPELMPLYSAYLGSSAPVEDKRTALLASFLPVLKNKRKQEQALAAITSAAGTDPSFASVLLTDPAILPADADGTSAAVSDLVAIESQGLSAQFFLGNDPAAAPDQTVDVEPLLSYVQTTTIGGTPTTGEVLTTTINGVDIPYQVLDSDPTLATLAGSVAAAINAATAADPVSGLPINQVVTASVLPPASATASVIAIAGLNSSGANAIFTLAVTAPAGGTESYVSGSQLPAGPGGAAIAASWSGFITVPADGQYDLNIATDPGAAISLQLGGVTVPGPPAPVGANGLWSNTGPISLTAGALVPIALVATSIKTTLSVSWQSQGPGWQPIGTQYLYPLNLVSRLGNTFVRFLKATSLASSLALTAKEIAFLATTASLKPGWLSSLIGRGWLSPPAQQGPDPATAAGLTTVLSALLDFSRIKAALSPADSRLLAALGNPSATLPVSTSVVQPPTTTLPVTNSALLSLTGWDRASVNALLTQFFGSPDPTVLSSVENFRRVYDAYAVVKTCGLSASVLISATTNAPSAATVGTLQSALRAQYAESDWLAVAGPINNTARMAQRDALVAYILQQLGDNYVRSLVGESTSSAAVTGATQLSFATTTQISTGMTVQGSGIAPGTAVTAVAPGAGGTTVTLSLATLTALPAGTSLLFVPPDTIAIATTDSLYEFFLIDTQNEPAVLTSRILLALSTTQLFIERIVRNLEPEVSPTDIDAAQWTWMKRYRVWQANREVFLWPENWLYPELRDDASPFFQQIMSSLLQGDITDDAATSAYLTYLTSLEEVAKLEPCGLYYLPASADADETSYVIARTAGARRKYYFRELTGGSWSPWAQVAIECEDMPLTPIVWNNRLFLFWLKVTKQNQPEQVDLQQANSNVQNSDIASLQFSDLQTYSSAATQTAGTGAIQVQAVLNWTEFYNGQWQPTKTSDVNAPTTIDNFDQSGPGSVESWRNALRIVPAVFTGANPTAQKYHLTFPLPDDALILAITEADSPGYKGGFILHNTHSLPVRLDDIYLDYTKYGNNKVNAVRAQLADLLDQPSPSRSFYPAAESGAPYTGGYSNGTFSIDYTGTAGAAPTYSNEILKYSWASRRVEPQPGLSSADAWDAPFIYEDRRNVFYVLTTQALGAIGEYRGFGLLAASQGGSAHSIPPLVLRQPVTAPISAEIQAINAGGGDPTSVQRYLSQGTTIDAGLAASTSISYQGQLISPIGSLAGLDPAADDDGQGA